MASMFEFYDFGILAFYKNEISAALFPPTLSPIQHTLCIYVLFWAGFATRPLGGGIFGHIGDVLGRKKALRLSIWMMAICTTLTGCIPTFRSIGYFSPILLLILRLCQGISTGGEISSAFVFIFESAPTDRRALWMSMLTVSSMGVFLALLMKLAIDHWCNEQQMIDEWGWRIPFWSGSLLSIIGLYSKWALEETPIFESIMETETAGKMIGWSDVGEGMAFKVAFCDNLGISLVLIGASALNHMTPYLFCVFMPHYLKSAEMHGWSDQHAYRNNLFLMLIGCTAVLITGYASDRYGAFRYVI